MDFQQFNGQHWSRTIPETYAAFAKSAAVLEATPMTEAKMMPRLLREIVETILDIHLDLGNWLQGFLPWEVPDGLYTTIAPNFFAIVHGLASRYPKAEEVSLVGKLIFAFEELVRTGKPRPGLAPDEEADLRFCYRTIIAGFTAKLHSAYWNLVRWTCQSPFRFRSVLRIVRRHRHFRLNPPNPSAEDWKRTTEILNGKLELLNQTIRHEHERTRRKIEGTERRIENWKDGLSDILTPVVSFIKRIAPRFKCRERGGEITQEQVARDFGVSRATVNRWEINQTANGPENKSNKYGYYKELRTNPDLRGAYYELVNCVKRYQAEKRKADKLGIRFVTFVRFHEEWLTHQPDKMRHLRMD